MNCGSSVSTWYKTLSRVERKVCIYYQTPKSFLRRCTIFNFQICVYICMYLQNCKDLYHCPWQLDTFQTPGPISKVGSTSISMWLDCKHLKKKKKSNPLNPVIGEGWTVLFEIFKITCTVMQTSDRGYIILNSLSFRKLQACFKVLQVKILSYIV